MYQYTPMTTKIERVQTGVRLEKRTLKVLKGLAEYLDLSVGELLEGIVLHVFEGTAPFSAETLAQVDRLRAVYGLTLTAADSHQLTDGDRVSSAAPARRAPRRTSPASPASVRGAARRERP
jgi:hypothetical protein